MPVAIVNSMSDEGQKKAGSVSSSRASCPTLSLTMTNNPSPSYFDDGDSDSDDAYPKGRIEKRSRVSRRWPSIKTLKGGIISLPTSCLNWSESEMHLLNIGKEMAVEVFRVRDPFGSVFVKADKGVLNHGQGRELDYDYE